MKTFPYIVILLILLNSCHTASPKKFEKKPAPKKVKINLNIKKGLDLTGDAIKQQQKYYALFKQRNLMIDGIKTATLPEGLTTVTLIAAGDIIPHGKVKQSGLTQKYTKKNPNFKFSFKEIAETIKDADIAFANLETPIRPDQEQWRSIPFKFNTPIALVKTLKDVGFDLLNLANNHLYDQGVKGVSTTIDELNKLKIPFIGIGKNYRKAIKPVIIKKKGITFGFLGFTTLINNDLNNYSNRKKPFVNRFDTPSAVKMVQKLKKKCDLVIVSIHWGIEYHKKPSIHQKRYTKALFKAGASVILGHHPHVLQPIIYNQQKDQLVVYSLGNFLSNQFFPLRYKAARHKMANREGVMLQLSFAPKNNTIALSGYKTFPTYIKKKPRKNGRYRILISALNERKDLAIKSSITAFMTPSLLEQFLSKKHQPKKKKRTQKKRK